MSVTSIGAVLDPQKLGSAPPASPAQGTSPAASSKGGAAKASISQQGQFLSQLQQLQQSDPSKFQTVLSDISTQLRAQAQKDGGTQGRALSSLADKFQQAAQTGNLSSIEPAHEQSGHHGGHHAAYQPASGQSNPLMQVSDVIKQVLSQDLGTTSTVE